MMEQLREIAGKMITLIGRIEGIFQALKRSWDYARFGWTAWDFDALTIENYLAFKLPRVHDALINGVCELESPKAKQYMKALRICIKISKRLEGDYERAYIRFIRKWGRGEVIFYKHDDSPCTRTKIIRESTPTPELEDQCRIEALIAFDTDQRQEERYRALLYRILGKYITQWWD